MAQPDVFESAQSDLDVAYIPHRGRPKAKRGGSTTPRANSLRRGLLAVDVVMLVAAWGVALSIPTSILAEVPLSIGIRALAVAGLTVVSLALFAAQHLYLTRICGVRSVELNRLGLSAALVGGSLFVSQAVSGDAGSRVVVGAVLMFLFTAFGRSAFDAWLKTMRAAGRYGRPMVLVGANDESMELAHLLKDHPEFGYTVVGVLGDGAERVRWDDGIPWLGGFDSAADAVAEQGASGALVAVSALSPEQLNRVTRDLLKRKIHVHLSPGLRGVSHRRLRALPISHEPIFYLEPVRLARWKLLVKRGIDLTAASILLVLTLPLLAVSMLAIKLQDRGPVLYRQVRVGRNGQEFTLLKLRTMRQGADAEIHQVTGLNERDGGPLFKASSDPRRTRVGRYLELASFDELPQLINVLRGQMSMVGPRPALPEEVARFDAELWTRHDVPPGITGLWQVEARDNPSFAAYRRLDLFYVENWSVALDLAIAFATVRSVLSRLFRSQS